MKRTKYIILFLMLLCETAAFAQSDPFITTWILPPGSSATSSISFNALTDGSVNYSWTKMGGSGGSGSGSFTRTTPDNVEIVISLNPGELLTLSMQPANLRRFFMDGLPSVTTSNLLLLDVFQWGDVPWTSMRDAFSNCQNLLLTIVAGDVPDLTNVTDMASMFFQCDKLIGPSNINSWNVSNVTNMASMFLGTDVFNRPIGNWDVSNVTNMSEMFTSSKAFNQPLGEWNTANVTTMYYMFGLASAFNQDLSDFELNNATNVQFMLASSGLDCVNYGKTLYGWASAPTTPSNLVLGAQDLKYGPPAAASRGELTMAVASGGKGWTILDDGEDATCDTPLPVDFGSISGSFNNGHLQIDWSTLTETNSSHFEIEASTDGVTFTKIGEAKSQAPDGNSDVALSYSFTTSSTSLFFVFSLLSLALGLGYKIDNRKRFSKLLAISGVFVLGFLACNKADMPLDLEKDAKIYVRVKQVDKDGLSKYSKIIKLVSR
ncbi:BspA family leucine-rich repeat surface protein [Niabella ginsengisoli]|uniref:DUF285 domain-containing protein n=1 Tax=Niabella ginsengisoli TaxID=522298 RepID=A0ABS9SMQ0_9BACT|nr:DUF285 domain-containing protein [Niabella ginsengisoli]MCH5599634.1 DUF285 domain-containing protein [Niabella ginsengisoli]